jgi:hypothetical protein
VAVLDNASYASGTMNIFLGNGDGTFQPAKTFVVDSGIDAAAFAVADFDMDGILDIAVINSCTNVQCNNGTFGILIGNGDGTFHDGVTLNIPSDPSVIVAANFNNDGIPDLAIGDDAKIEIFDGASDGTFNLAGSVSGGGMPIGLLTADFNGDGNTDLGILVCCSGVFYVTLGNGDNQFGPLLDGLRVVSSTPVAADFNGGIPDVATSGGQVLLGNGDGTFQLINLSPDAGGVSVQSAILGNDTLRDINCGGGSLNPVSVFTNATK